MVAAAANAIRDAVRREVRHSRLKEGLSHVAKQTHRREAELGLTLSSLASIPDIAMLLDSVDTVMDATGLSKSTVVRRRAAARRSLHRLLGTDAAPSTIRHDREPNPCRDTSL